LWHFSVPTVNINQFSFGHVPAIDAPSDRLLQTLYNRHSILSRAIKIQ